MVFNDLLWGKDGMIKGPFGGDVKKSLFISKGDNAYKVLEQGVVLNQNIEYGNYYLDRDYVQKKLSRFIVKEGDILITGAGTLGKLFLVPKLKEPSVINQALIRIRLNESIINKKYFQYYFKFHIINMISGINGDSVIPNLPPLSIIKDTKVSIPELQIQQKIATVLSALDDKVELNNRINVELEEMAKMLYDYWFVQFDFPNANGKPYKSSGGEMVYNEVLKGMVPQGWTVKDLSEISSELVRGISPKYVEHDGIPVINQRCIRNNTVDFSFCRQHNIQSKPVTRLTQIGDILVNSTGVGTLGRVAMVKWLKNVQTTVDSHVTIVRANNEQVNPLFLGFSLLNKQTEIEKLGEGSTGQTELSRENLGKLKILLSERELQNEFASIVKPLFEKAAINEQQNQQLAMLRDWLLPMLINGQVKVMDVAKEHNAAEKQSALAAEPLITYEEPLKLNIPDGRKNFAKQVLAGKIVSEFKDDANFTDIKFQKIQFLAEHLIEADLKLNYYYQAAGPYDNVFMHTIYNDFRKQKWFDCQNKRFVPLEKQGKIEEYYQGYFGPAHGQLNMLFELLYQSTEAEAEIIATLYAVWNNRIIEKRTITDKELVQDFYQWSDRKQQYSEVQVTEGLQWLRTHQMEPKGFGKLIKKANYKK